MCNKQKVRIYVLAAHSRCQAQPRRYRAANLSGGWCSLGHIKALLALQKGQLYGVQSLCKFLLNRASLMRSRLIEWPGAGCRRGDLNYYNMGPDICSCQRSWRTPLHPEKLFRTRFARPTVRPCGALRYRLAAAQQCMPNRRRSNA